MRSLWSSTPGIAVIQTPVVTGDALYSRDTELALASLETSTIDLKLGHNAHGGPKNWTFLKFVTPVCDDGKTF